MQLIPIYNSRGELGAFLGYPNLYNQVGEWIGFVTADREVYSVLGNYVGALTDDHRILRERTPSAIRPPRVPPPPVPPVSPPATVPLAPLMRELTMSMIDVLLEEPEKLHTEDVGEFRDDLD